MSNATADVLASLRDSARTCDSASMRCARITRPAVHSVTRGRYSIVPPVGSYSIVGQGK